MVLAASLVGILSLSTPIDAQQDPNADSGSNTPASTPTAKLVTVRGIVRNTITQDPMPRVLVQVGGESGPAALTDGDGRFEISDVAPGPQMIQLRRPGFHDAPAASSAPEEIIASFREITHSVFVTSGMAELEFSMKPFNVIRGRVELSTGEPASGIQVSLLRRGVTDGRIAWQHVSGVHTNSDGMFRFADLEDGAYLLYSASSLETENPVFLVQPGRDDQVAQNGYPMMFYPDARDPSGAAQIQVRNGDQAQANLHLTLEPFHMVRAEVTTPSLPPSSDSRTSFNATVTDAQGNELSYPAAYDSASHSIQMSLPDGTYSLRVSQFAMRPFDQSTRRRIAHSNEIFGQADFTVAGKPLRVRVGLTPQSSGSVQVTVTRTARPSEVSNDIHIIAMRSGAPLAGGMMNQLAVGSVPGTLQTNSLSPGQYWVYSFVQQTGLCESSFTAGGTSLAREPLAVGASGATAPLNLILRDDCASLKLSLPANLSFNRSGEESAMTIYVVPDFDSTAPVIPIVLRPSSGGSAALGVLTPGAYHVYAFKDSVNLEYRNRELLSKLPSQPVTLEPSSTSNLVVEVPAR